jgi:hypothetical protein
MRSETNNTRQHRFGVRRFRLLPPNCEAPSVALQVRAVSTPRGHVPIAVQPQSFDRRGYGAIFALLPFSERAILLPKSVQSRPKRASKMSSIRLDRVSPVLHRIADRMEDRLRDIYRSRALASFDCDDIRQTYGEWFGEDENTRRYDRVDRFWQV